MSHQSILTYMRPGFPQESKDDTGYRTVIEYVGPKADLQASGIDTGITWGDFPGLVKSAAVEPIDNTKMAFLTVTMERKFDPAD